MKKILLSLFVGFVGIIGFCSSGNIMLEEVYSDSLNAKGYRHTYHNINENHTYDLVCYRNISSNCNYNDIFWNFDDSFNPGDFSNSSNNGLGGGGLGTCTTEGPTWISASNSKDCFLEIKGYVFSGFNSEFCQSEFNLIPEEDIDTNYCVSNDLCPENTGSSASWSELVINDIVHQSAPLITIDIPEEFNWNYSVDENEFALSISGYNVDTEYIDGIITAQNVKPNAGTLNKIITELIPLFVPGLVIILFIWFVFRFVKKIF